MRLHPHARAVNNHVRPRLDKRFDAEGYQSALTAGNRKTTAVTPSGGPVRPTPSVPNSGSAAPPLTSAARPTSAAPAPRPVTSDKVIQPPKGQPTTAPTKDDPTTSTAGRVGNPLVHSQVTSSEELDTDTSTVASTQTKAPAVAVSSTTDDASVSSKPKGLTSSNAVSYMKPSSTPTGSNTRSTGVTSGTAAAAAAGSSSGMSGGAVAGIVIAVLLGCAALGALAFYWFKKQKSRDNIPGWTKMDDDVTPFRGGDEKPATGYYGSTPATAPATRGTGSPGGLDVPGQNGYYSDHGRPVSDANENFAGYGAGRVYNGAYAAAAAAPVASYGINQPYADQPHTPHSAQFAPPGMYYGNAPGNYDQHQPNPFEDPARSPTGSAGSGGPRQLVGPGQQYPQPGQYPHPVEQFGASGQQFPQHSALVPAPVPLGRPEAPSSYDDIAAAEMYADDRYADDHTATPMASHPAQQQASSPYPENQLQLQQLQAQQQMQWPVDSQTSPVPAPISIPSPAPVPLPQLAPMSPLLPTMMEQPTTDNHEEDETTRMYGEVAAAAGLPVATARYQHGMPLAPVQEVPTPMTNTLRPLPSTPSALSQVTMPSPPSAPSPALVNADTVPTQPQAPVPAPAVSAPQALAAPAAKPATPATQQSDDAYGGM